MPMIYGWRPTESCYKSVAQAPNQNTVDTEAGPVAVNSSCAPTPWWFWISAGLALVMGKKG